MTSETWRASTGRHGQERALREPDSGQVEEGKKAKVTLEPSPPTKSTYIPTSVGLCDSALAAPRRPHRYALSLGLSIQNKAPIRGKKQAGSYGDNQSDDHTVQIWNRPTELGALAPPLLAALHRARPFTTWHVLRDSLETKGRSSYPLKTEKQKQNARQRIQHPLLQCPLTHSPSGGARSDDPNKSSRPTPERTFPSWVRARGGGAHYTFYLNTTKKTTPSVLRKG